VRSIAVGLFILRAVFVQVTTLGRRLCRQ